MSKQDIIQTFRNMDNSVWKNDIKELDFSPKGIIINKTAFFPADWGVFEAMEHFVKGGCAC